MPRRRAVVRSSVRRVGRRCVPVLAGVIATASLAGCFGGGAASRPRTPQPAGATPSAIAKEVCSRKAQGLIGDVLGETARVATPTWVRHLYSCEYRYRSGTMVLSVKELSSWSETYGYFDALGRSLHRTGAPIFELGQAAFRVRDGSVVVRKDWKVLLVDVHGMPRQFGDPPGPIASVALSVADVILECWHGD